MIVLLFLYIHVHMYIYMYIVRLVVHVCVTLYYHVV